MASYFKVLSSVSCGNLSVLSKILSSSRFCHHLRLCANSFNNSDKTHTAFHYKTHVWGNRRKTHFSELSSCNQTIYRFLVLRNMSSAAGESDKNISYEQLIELKSKKNITLIDVREKDELKETGEIPGSFNIPLGEVPEALNRMTNEYFEEKYGVKKPGFNDVLVFSCRSGKRSLIALQEALKAGYNKSLNFRGGWLEWEEKYGNSPK